MCGIIGILSTTKKDVGLYIYDALNIIQHRGQDAAGIMTANKGRFYMRKGNGLVRNVFRTKHMEKLIGDMGIGHVRYCLLYTSPSPRDQRGSRMAGCG